MDDEYCSWVRRVKFSRTIYHRVDSAKLPSSGLLIDSSWLDDLPNPKGLVSDSSLNSKIVVNCTDLKKEVQVPSWLNKEKPEPNRKKSIINPYQSSPGLNDSPLKRLYSMKFFEKDSIRKQGSWPWCLEQRRVRVGAVETAEEWVADLSDLYIGARFACGAHSKLYQGIYKGKPVAVKIIRLPEEEENRDMAVRLEKQYTREVDFLSRLFHENVIKLVGACKKPPIFCIITEYLSCGSLRAFLHKMEHQALPLDKLIAIALNVAKAMEYIHAQGIIHRDLKPENILFDQDFCVKIADFGIACKEDECDVLAEESGTYRWMAPEMIKHKPYGRKVDVYSFGLLLWEMATGRIPYEEMTPIQAAFAVLVKDLRPVVPDACPAPLLALMEQCWSSCPEKRPEFGQIVEMLEKFKSVLYSNGVIGTHT